MQVDKHVIDQVNAVITIVLDKADYQEKVEKTLKNYRKKANVPGFRPGNVPAGLINKLYGKAVLAEEVQQLVGESLYNYIKDNQLNILGEPLASVDQPAIDFDTQESFTFKFDLALSPELTFTLNKKDAIPYYTIDVTDDMVNEQVKSLASRNGSYVKVDAAEEKDVVKGLLTELQADGQPAAEGVVVEDAVLMPAYVKDAGEKAKFMGVTVGQTVVFNPAKAYEKAEAELASLLHVAKDVATTIESDFSFEIKEITRFQDGELNQELFDSIYGKDEVKTEADFRERVKTSIEAQFVPESDYRFMIDAKTVLLKKLSDVAFPVDTLKRWVLATKKDQTEASVDTDMPAMIEDLKWHLMKEQIVKENNLTVTDAELLETAKKVTRAQFAQYGMMNVPEDLLTNYAGDMLKKEETRQNILDQAMSAVVANHLKGVVKLNQKAISMEDFNKLYA